MSLFPVKISSALALVAALPLLVAGSAQAQKLMPAASAAPAADSMPDRLISAHVRDGVLTIDGMVAKVQLNYDIEHSGYMYFFVPGVGTAVVSMAPLADGAKVLDAFDGEKLAFSVEGHTIELSSTANLLGKHKKADAFVRMDHASMAISRYPRVGYGDTTASPYIWPLSNPDLASKGKVDYVVTPPATPKNLLPQSASSKQQ